MQVDYRKMSWQLQMLLLLENSFIIVPLIKEHL